ncbi:MAG: DUF2948 family protein [Alphaproteobacteria bacterium]|jgi:hypothetical protein|nr:DUF2948 family protein [Alphaproteobacteria bacterium]
MTGALKLTAADAEDLEILSARLQDAAGKLKDVAWLPKQRRFVALFNRFRWEESDGPGTRVRAVLRFDGVSKVQSSQVKQGAPEAVISLLAIRFTPDAAKPPAGEIELVLAGGGAIRLAVECIDAELADQTAPWAARGRPNHEDNA